MSEYCKECDSVTLKIKGIDVGYIGLTGFALMFGVIGYRFSYLYQFSHLEELLILSIGIILLLSFSLAYNVFKHSKLQEIKE